MCCVEEKKGSEGEKEREAKVVVVTSRRSDRGCRCRSRCRSSPVVELRLEGSRWCCRWGCRCCSCLGLLADAKVREPKGLYWALKPVSLGHDIGYPTADLRQYSGNHKALGSEMAPLTN